MRKVINKFLILNLILVTHISCSQELTISNIVAPTKKHFKLKLEEDVKMYSDFPEAKKQIMESENYYFENRVNIKEKVIDSLKLLKNKKLIIIDAIRDFNGNRKDATYFFYDSKVLVSGYEIKTEKKNQSVMYVEESNQNKLKQEEDDSEIVYNYFNKDDFKEIKGNILFSGYVYFEVTVIINNKVGFYTIASTKEGYKVTKL